MYIHSPCPLTPDPDPSNPMPDFATTLQQTFGFTELRPGQQDVIERLLEKKSTLAIFPTGGGKSLCYQLPGLLLEGTTVVISPLIALMKDQIDFLQQRRVAAARLDSSLGRDEAIAVYDDIRAGRTKILYVSPERLGNERFLGMLERLDISLLAVDEAHCISEWGHNFRPDYLKIAALAERIDVDCVLALTATATPEVADDIAAAFEIAADDVIRTGFYRPNLELRVTPCTDFQRKEVLLSKLTERPHGPTIVYVTLQRTAEEVAEFLTDQGLSARAYHAGLDADTRTATQEAFMQADDMIVVATIAFGMGIDKSNIRGVYHYNLPKSLESYCQEIGRAGRDGQPAVCETLACRDDVITLENFVYGDTPPPEAVASLVRELIDAAVAGMSSSGPHAVFDVSYYELANAHDVRDLVVRTLLTYLELGGVLEATGPFYSVFRFYPLTSSADILAHFDPARAEFLANVFRSAKRGRKWFTLDAEAVARKLGQPRGRIVTALDYLEQQGHLVVEAAGVRHGYRLLERPPDLEALIETLAHRFLDRERREIDRIEKTVKFFQQPNCLWGYLLDHFGEQHDSCGHCSRCQGEQPVPLPGGRFASPDQATVDRARRLQSQHPAALATPRQLARFLCGIPSPTTTRLKLRQEPDFAAFRRVPFERVLNAVS